MLKRKADLLRELLRQASLSSMPIARLAMQCGFSDAAHATRTFKAFYGMTPRDYRGEASGVTSRS